MIAGAHSALSGLQVFTKKIEKTAHNVANLNTEGFKKDRVIVSSQSPQGVQATLEQVQTGALRTASTNQENALTEPSNVDLVEEIPDLLLSQQAYTANLATLKTTNQMMQSLLDITA